MFINFCNIKKIKSFFVKLESYINKNQSQFIFYNFFKLKIKFRKYDPYERMREICSYPTKYLHTCPSELLKKAEEKGITIGNLNGSVSVNSVDEPQLVDTDVLEA